MQTVATHWGTFIVEAKGSEITHVRGLDNDQAPSHIGQSLMDALDPNCRIAQPMIREGFLKHGHESDGGARGTEHFVEVSWDQALDLAASALSNIKSKYSNNAIYGSSYGWASAGRFHHAQSQIHRFLNMFGGYVSSKDTYSVGAGHRIMYRVMGLDPHEIVYGGLQCEDMIGNANLVVAFGGIPMKNVHVNGGGVGDHSAENQLRTLKKHGAKFVNVSPISDDMASFLDPDWISIHPNTDTALMLALAHTLYSEGLHDEAFLKSHCVGFDEFLPYLLGTTDGVPKSPAWAERITGVSAGKIRHLAFDMAKSNTVISLTWSLQRAEHGEQPWWMGLVLACMLGQMRKPGCGIVYGLGCSHQAGFRGRKMSTFGLGHFAQGQNPVSTFIPVARITDMLLNPGKEIDFDGQKVTYPEIKAIMWAGGNPFHHHQDLNLFRKAWAKPEVIIVNEINWNATARHADIVFPITTALERNDLAGASNDTWITPSKKVVPRHEGAKDDYDVYSGLAERLGFKDSFTEGRSADEWVEHLYEVTFENARSAGVQLPNFLDFWNGGPISFADQLPDYEGPLDRFLRDPTQFPLPLSSTGKIEIFSQTIADFHYEDCPGHPVWLSKREWLGADQSKQFPLHLITNQPKGKLHSQLDHGRSSTQEKSLGRTKVRLHSKAAKARSIESGDCIQIYNDRGACLAIAEIVQDIHPNVIELPTGAWYNPVDPKQQASLEVHGNPNVLTQDLGSSKLGQGCSAHSCLVEIERFENPIPDVTVFAPPPIKKSRQ